MPGIGSSTTYGGGQTRTDAWGDIKPYVPYNAASGFNALVTAPQRSPYVPPPTLTGQAGNGDEQRAQNLATRAQILQLQSASRGPIRKPRADIGNTSGPVYEMDPGEMSAIDRQLYLPANSQFEDPRSEAAAASQRQQNETFADAAYNALLNRRRLHEATGGIG